MNEIAVETRHLCVYCVSGGPLYEKWAGAVKKFRKALCLEAPLRTSGLPAVERSFLCFTSQTFLLFSPHANAPNWLWGSLTSNVS